MIAETKTISFQGIQAVPVTIQTQMAGGSLPSFSIVGLADKAVSESRERIRSAFHTLGIALPPKRITVSLSPANIYKEGNHYDLPLALSLLMALDILPAALLQEAISLGELGLDGSIKSVRGTLSAALLAAEQNSLFICPGACGPEAVWGGGAHILACHNLIQVVNHFKGTQLVDPPQGTSEPLSYPEVELTHIRGHDIPKRVLFIAAAGGHNLLMSGPPGTGKSMLASCLSSLLPPLSAQEALEVTMIHSLAGQSDPQKGLLRKRPFRSPHHSISLPALVGGGRRGGPGEISLAHHGVLFLDELPEFPRHVLDSLRQSIETKQAVVSRVDHHHTYPASFQLVAAMNPCRCGYMGIPDRQCHKAPLCGQMYQQSISGPILDRMDLFIEVPEVSTEILAAPMNETEKSLTNHFIQEIRDFSHGRALCQSTQEMEAHIRHISKSHDMLLRAKDKLRLSVRGYYRSIRVARTIADMEKSVWIAPEHVAEALSYRVRGL
jgi:magnesium chelatase family protein